MLFLDLQNYWTFDTSANDVAGDSNMTLVLRSQLTNDRFGVSNSALSISKGYATIPPRMYFNPANGGLTIMCWIKLISFEYFSKFIDIADSGKNNICRFTFVTRTGEPRFTLVRNGNGVALDFNQLINLNEWKHLAVSVVGSNGFAYIDGQLTSTRTG